MVFITRSPLFKGVLQLLLIQAAESGEQGQIGASPAKILGDDNKVRARRQLEVLVNSLERRVQQSAALSGERLGLVPGIHEPTGLAQALFFRTQERPDRKHSIGVK